MEKYAVFLRGVNVGGITIKMAALRAALERLPLTGVKTLLASGNVVCTSTKGPAEVKERVEACLRESFGYDAWVVVLDRDTLAAVIDASPYPSDSAEQHSYVTLSSDPAILDELAALGGALDGVELARLSPEALAWPVTAGATLDSPFSKLSAKARYKSTTTTRNLRTLIKCRDAMR